MKKNKKKGPLAGKNIVSVFGVPLFTTDRVDDVPDILSPQPEKNSQAQEQESGFFSSFVSRLNPFKR